MVEVEVVGDLLHQALVEAGDRMDQLEGDFLVQVFFSINAALLLLITLTNQQRGKSSRKRNGVEERMRSRRKQGRRRWKRIWR